MRADTVFLSGVRALRGAGSSVRQMAVFIDQLERTFEDGDTPDAGRLRAASEAVTRLLVEFRKSETPVRLFIEALREGPTQRSPQDGERRLL